MPERRRGRPPHPDILTPAERRVLEELRKGGTNAEIAVRIGIGPETVKTHVSNMLAKLQREDRHELAAWREEEAPRRRWLWLLAPVPGKPLAVFGVVAGVAVVIAVILLLLALVRGEEEGLYIEGVGKIEGPVAVIRVADLESSRERVAALDLPTGKRWFIDGAVQFVLRPTLVGDPQIALARDRLVAWDDDTIQTVKLDGQVERVLFRAEKPVSAPILSPAGDLLAFTLLPSVAVVVIDLHSGKEVLRLPGDDPRLPPHGKLELERWSTDGGALLVSAGSVLSAAHVVLELDGSVHAFPEDVRSTTEIAFSPDLRYLVRGRLLSSENYDSDVLFALGQVRVFGKDWVESLAIVEVDTGRELAVVMNEGSILVHVVGPVDGRVVYQSVPVSALPVDSDEAADSAAYEAAVHEAILETMVVHVFDLATGTATPMDQLDRSLRDALELVWLREDTVDYLAIIGHCIEPPSVRTACDSAGDMYDRIYSERDADREPLWWLLGFIWLDETSAPTP